MKTQHGRKKKKKKILNSILFKTKQKANTGSKNFLKVRNMSELLCELLEMMNMLINILYKWDSFTILIILIVIYSSVLVKVFCRYLFSNVRFQRVWTWSMRHWVYFVGTNWKWKKGEGLRTEFQVEFLLFSSLALLRNSLWEVSEVRQGLPLISQELSCDLFVKILWLQVTEMHQIDNTKKLEREYIERIWGAVQIIQGYISKHQVMRNWISKS